MLSRSNCKKHTSLNFILRIPFKQLNQIHFLVILSVYKLYLNTKYIDINKYLQPHPTLLYILMTSMLTKALS